ncbi:MAG: hypothetical protein ABIK73_06930 [candidate division WOR-3 bacterium]
MCHIVSCRNDYERFYALEGKKYPDLVGYTFIEYDADKKVFHNPIADNHVYNVRFENDAILFRMEPVASTAELKIPCIINNKVFVCYCLDVSIKTGAFIYPLGVDVEKRDDVYIVVFRPGAVVFYDGRVVSVNHFLLPHSSHINRKITLPEHARFMLDNNDRLIAQHLS